MTASTVLTGSALAAAVAGALDVEVSADGVRPWRLPVAARRYAPPALALMAEFCAGVHLRMLTAAPTVELEVTVTRLSQRGSTRAPDAAPFVAVVDGRQTDRVDVLGGALVRERDDRSLFREPGGARSSVVLALRDDADSTGGAMSAAAMRLVEVWLPVDAGVVLHSVSAASALLAAPADERPRWLHYGSSISHGASAGTPLGTWPRLVAAELGLAGVNLGFGGNAMLDPSVARALAATPAAAITLELGINIVGADAMRERTFVPALHGFLDTLRDGHPTTPIGLVTAIACPAVETTPGPIRAGADGRATGTPREVRPGDGTLTLARTRTLIEQVAVQRAPDDPALHLIDGLTLLGTDEHHHLPDGLHPDPAGHTLIAHRLTTQAADPGAPAGRLFPR
ncbi:SGNH/GDSL hydrolase family protein [Herbiconiux sp. KACC 21604]|uniref:GDSL-type esterase/lipase family protein n=1 Tax=unclassified Herbiconiux TaxID=2618217 RepID=UPI001492C806|nr:SGNH/GDSL hydrolase family protein [Herbiconiux sp. SALV-R1]QJU55697.1 lipase [Herbiconiux sp. SALV-R1]WPO86900.1 SGNH/GDSL hydrolase family protein [Herbiconiux sp. KACC 21604]